MENVIKVINLKKTYALAKGKTLEAVRDISFSVEKGEVFGILGPNGAGKTTTLEIIEGLKQQTSGNVEVLGLNNLTQIQEIKKLIGIQLQSSQYLHHLSLGELLDLFASLYNKQANRAELLNLVDLKEKVNEEVKNLSGGQKQRFTIATSLVHSPEILFLDEPTTGLDPAARRSMWQLIKKINSSGVTIVMTTHYMEEAEFLCNRVAIMDSGKILEMGEPRKLIEQLSESVQVSFLSNDAIDSTLFEKLDGVKKIYSAVPKTIIELVSLEKVPAIIEKLKTEKINFSGFTVKSASLEDVYLQLTGKEYGD